LGDIAIDGSIILKWIIKKLDWIVWTGFIWLRVDNGIRLFGTRNGPKLSVCLIKHYALKMFLGVEV
jgi:hypothetical protein